MIRGITTPGLTTAGFNAPSFTTASNFTDTTQTLPAIVDPHAGLAGADPKALTLAPTTTDDNALRVLRGVSHGDTPLSGEFTGPGVNTNGDQRDYQNLGSLGSEDIMAVAFIVMMEATKSAQEDLKSIMDGVKLINNAKSKMRAVADEFNPYPPK